MPFTQIFLHSRIRRHVQQLVLRTANSFDYDPMRNQWIVADFNTANLQLGGLGGSVMKIDLHELFFSLCLQEYLK
uniref:Uncharacterized protein n=3 Tax=Candidatus Kentrum eta TaxID=2126337 RepID=A0A450UM73_9GAMM|nr:MAG: hypothetical protein BECKH772B_GA0070898_1004716 [Candidatus Kentron sp. H]